jgi:hypothetical protein
MRIWYSSKTYLIGVIFLLTIGCENGRRTNSQLAFYLETHESAATGLPIAVEFEELFPGQTDHFITHLALYRRSGSEELNWNSVAIFGGRYNLQMEIPVTVDYDNRTVNRSGKPAFGLREYTLVENNAGQISSNSRTLAIFGEAEWNQFYTSDGDFSVFGVKLNRDVPLPGFEKIVQAARAPLLSPRFKMEDSAQEPLEFQAFVMC